MQVYFCIEKVILLSLAFLVPCCDPFTTEWCDIPNLVRYTLKEKQAMVSVTRIKLEHEISFFQDRKRACHSNLSFKFLYGLSWFQISIKTHYLSLVHHLPYFANFSTKHTLWTSFFLKKHPLKTTAAHTLKTSEGSFTKYIWHYIRLISEIDNISYIILYWNILLKFVSNIFVQD